jgi:hypothetical protein
MESAVSLDPTLAAAPAATSASRSRGWATPAQLAGPAAVLSLVGTIAAIVAAGSDDVAALKSPVMIAAGVAGLVAVILLAFALIELVITLPVFRSGRAMAGISLAVVGTTLMAGGQWSLVFVVPGLADVAPEIASKGLGTVLAGFVVSFVLAGIGWFAVGRTLFSQGVGRLAPWLICIGGVLCITPLPSRFLLIAIGVSVLMRRLPTATGATS